MRKKGRTDENQKRIVEALRKAGRFVVITSGVGDGFPDLIVANPASGRLSLLEVKKEKGAFELTEEQKKFWASWPLQNLHITRSIQEALDYTR